ncbi:PREDICTED: phospholipase A2, membrane associated-like [Elephantulus edwardii]|uniref:phospholipase A2, membrane associated-like n=1 Tax=Elephantulus edwardii TaxID=28737 RepID=UPI0003F0B847|nr:PREDICTED: phospholipase A2, membrane associated-like [Elephantulus edwardii]
MKILMLLAVIMVLGFLQAQGSSLDFKEMIDNTLGRDAALNYSSYGCYCGVDGKGSPKDATDRCCAKHNCCYRKLKKFKCDTNLLKYKFSTSGSKIICEDKDVCKRLLCQCDRKAAYCFAKNKNTYNKSLQFYPNSMCTGKTLRCRKRIFH